MMPVLDGAYQAFPARKKGSRPAPVPLSVPPAGSPLAEAMFSVPQGGPVMDPELREALREKPKDEEPEERAETEETAEGGSGELERLRQMLEEQKQATLLAIRSSSELEQQLNSARSELNTAKTELDKKKKQYAAGPKGGRTNFTNQQAEIATLRANLYQAEKTLAREQQVREMEAKQASRKVSELSGELATVQAKAAATPSGQRWWKTIGIAAAACGAGILAVVAWQQTHPVLVTGAQGDAAAVVSGSVASGSLVSGSGKGAQSSGGAATGAGGAGAVAGGNATGAVMAGVRMPNGMPNPAALRRARPNEAAHQAAAAASTRGDFSGALDRLDYALQAFPGVKPEQVLRAVYQSSKECALVWNQGRPALLYGSGPVGENALAATVSQCADAIEKLR